MSFTFTCDYCGDLIPVGAAFATVDVTHTNHKNLPKPERWTGGYAGHYHQPACWQKVHDAVQLIHEAGQELEAIPTMTFGQEMRVRNRRDLAVVRGPDGIASLGLRPDLLRDLRHAGVLTIAQAREKLARGEKLRAIGPTRLERLREALDAHDDGGES